MRSFIDRVEWPPQIEGALIPISRFLIIVGCALALMEVGGIPAGWLTAFMGAGGAAVGFASSRSIGNFIAGLYVLASRPFMVGDYVKIGNVEGVVKEITINYTKIFTPLNTMVLLSNQEVLSKNITNFSLVEDGRKYYCYSFEVGFDHSVSSEKLHSLFEELSSKYAKILPKRPEYAVTTMGRVERKYAFYLYFDRAEDVFTIQPKFLDELIAGWEKAKASG